MFIYNIKRLPFVSMTGRVREKTGWSHNGRSNQINLLTVIHKGECVFRINETDHRLKAGDAVIVPKNTYYKPHTDSFCEYTFFHFDGDLVPVGDGDIEVFFANADPKKSSFYGYSEEGSTELFLDNVINFAEKLTDVELLLTKSINTKRSSKGKMLLALRFSELLLYLSELLSQRLSEQLTKENTYPQSLSKIIYYIKENYTSNIRLEDICRHTNISKQYCMRLFKKHMNTTINDYILDLKMKHAAYLLRETYMNVNQTADYLGFSSVSYFSRVFKKYYGVAPTLYAE